MNPPSVSGKSRDRWLLPLFALCPRGVGIRATFPKILCLHVVISSFPAPLCGCLLWCITRLRLLSVLRGWFRVSVRCHNSYGTSFTITWQIKNICRCVSGWLLVTRYLVWCINAQKYEDQPAKWNLSGLRERPLKATLAGFDALLIK